MTDVTQEPEQTPDGTPAAEDAKSFSAEYVKQLRDEAKTYRLQLRELTEKFGAIEAQAKTQNEQKLAEEKRWQELAEQKTRELEEIKTQYERERLAALRLRIAAEKQLPTALAERLAGSSEDELRADAEALAALIPAQNQSAPTRQTTQLPSGEAANNRDEKLKSWLFGQYGSN